jgi:hypothetical protein
MPTFQVDPGHASLVSGEGSRSPLHPASLFNTGPLASPRERVIGEHRVVEDHGLGLAQQQADLQLVPELSRVGAGLMLAQPVEPAPGLDAMAQAVVGQR